MIEKKKIEQTVWENSLHTCQYVEGYENADSMITVKCLIHNHLFTTKWENIRRSTRAHHICPYCKQKDIREKNKDSSVKLQCDYCGTEYYVPLSKVIKSKSGLHFCCREHKDLAQQIKSGEKFQPMRPQHYGDYCQDYRKTAFDLYPHVCAVCNYNEDEDLLEVHHIDENRMNNNPDNLIILCCNCHKKLTSHKYELINRKRIVKK